MYFYSRMRNLNLLLKIETKSMNDPKIITALIGASVALLVSFISLLLNIYSVKAMNRNQREIEKMKFNFEKEKMEFQEKLTKKSEKSIAEKRILNVLQVLKDSGYSLLSSISQSDEQYAKSLHTWELSLTATIGIYQETYMDVKDELRSEIHDAKNILHYARLAVEDEIFKFEKKKGKKKRIDPSEIEDLIEKITSIQNNLLN